MEPEASNPPLTPLEGEPEVNGGPAWTPVVSSQVASAKSKVRGGGGGASSFAGGALKSDGERGTAGPGLGRCPILPLMVRLPASIDASVYYS